MPTNSVFCLVTSRSQATRIVGRLRAAGFSNHDISVHSHHPADMAPSEEVFEAARVLDLCTVGAFPFCLGKSGTRARAKSLPGCLQPSSFHCAETRPATAARRSQGPPAQGPDCFAPTLLPDPGVPQPPD